MSGNCVKRKAWDEKRKVLGKEGMRIWEIEIMSTEIWKKEE